MTGMLMPAFGEATLSDCDREIIHTPGAIQAHGILLVLSEPDLVIRQASDNMRRHLGLATEHMLGKELSLLLDEHAMDSVRSAMVHDLVEPVYLPPLTTSVGLRMEALIHRTEAGLILELEPLKLEANLNLPVLFREMLNAVHAAPSVVAACAEVARQLRQITGFDRVMVYRFCEDDTGVVIAEDRREDLLPFLGLHYPASDIPAQARKLFLLNLLRVWVDTDKAPAAMLPALDPVTAAPLDMSRCVLRAASPIHMKYLRNMGVAASMALSILKDGRLWGMIACHHASERHVSHAHRVACEALGNLLTVQIDAKEHQDSLAETVRLHAWSIRALASLGAGGALFDTLQGMGLWLMQFVPAIGVVVHVDGHTATFGRVPDAATLEILIDFLETRTMDGVLATNKLDGYLQSMPSPICGLLAVPVSREPGDVLMWFRPEIVQTVAWAGNPTKPVGFGPSGDRLTPRASFAAWVETVRGHSEPWSGMEMEAARAFGLALVKRPRSNTSPAPQPLATDDVDLRIADAVLLAQNAGEVSRQLLKTLELLSESLGRH